MLRSLAGLVIALMLPLASASAQDAGTLPAPATIGELHGYRELIEQRRVAAEALYSYANAAETFRSAFREGGVSEPTIDNFASVWAGWFSTTFDRAAKEVYRYHLDALTLSIQAVAAAGAAPASDVGAIRSGITAWVAFEERWRAILSETVDLEVQSARSWDAKKQLEATLCAGDEGCEQAKAAALAEIERELSRLADQYELNKKAIEQIPPPRFFEPIGTAPAAECRTVSLAYRPSQIYSSYQSHEWHDEQKAIPDLRYLPAGCRPPSGEPKFEFIERKETGASGDGFQSVATFSWPLGSVVAWTPRAALATVEVTHAPLPPAKSTVTILAQPPCERMMLAYEPVHVGGVGQPKFTMLPANCKGPDYPSQVAFASEPASIGWVEAADSAHPGQVNGLRAGTLTVNAVWQGLPAQAVVQGGQ